MKRIVLKLGLYSLATAIVLTSCVSKRKYTEAQNSIQQLKNENAECTAKTTSLQQNYSTLEERNKTLQTTYDSTLNLANTEQHRWSTFQTYYSGQKTSVQQLHQQLHTDLDDLIGAGNVTTSSNKIYVTLPENVLFKPGSSTLTTKGSQTLAKLADAVKNNPDIEIDISSVDYGMNATAATYSNPSDNSTNTTVDNTTVKNNKNNNTYTTNQNDELNQNRKMNKAEDKTYNQSTVKTKKYHRTNGTQNPSGFTAKNKTTYKSESAATTYKSTPKRKYGTSKDQKYMSGSESWSMNYARAGSIARTLTDNGIPQTRVIIGKTQPSNGTSKGQKAFQITLTPKSEYYQMMDQSTSGTTGMRY